MQINRKVLAVGLLSEVTTLSYGHLRKVLCTYDLNTKVACDVINNTEYQIRRPLPQRGIYVTNVNFLNDILASLGYPEILEDVHISRIMDEDFEKIFIETGIIEDLYKLTEEELSNRHLENDYKFLKTEFNLTSKEIEKSNRQKQKKKWFNF